MRGTRAWFGFAAADENQNAKFCCRQSEASGCRQIQQRLSAYKFDQDCRRAIAYAVQPCAQDRFYVR
jgi:hypothetical protein